MADSALVMTYGATSISPNGPGTVVDDCPTDGISERKVCFDKADLTTLFATLPSGNTTVTVTVSVYCRLTGITFQGSIAIKVHK